MSEVERERLRRALERSAQELERYRWFVREWSYDGKLQTFEDRERFRKAATELLG